MRKPSNAGRHFTREDIYRIREFFDEKRADNWLWLDIARELDVKYYPTSLQTLIRIGKRESYREIGVGPTERANISNRLLGEARETGDRIHTPKNYQMESELTELEVAEREKMILSRGIPPPIIGPDGLLMTQGDQAFSLLMGRAKDKPTIRGSFDEPPDLPPDGGDESPEAILARNGEKE